MSNNNKIESPNIFSDAIRLPVSKSALGKDARIAARKWIEEAQEKAKFARLIRTLDSGGTYKPVNILVQNLRDA